MKKYIGTKTIMAMPMAKSEAEKVLNRSLADAKGGEDGYLVEYPDGYKSWSPKETFEEAYKVADTYLDRMRIEYADVKEMPTSSVATITLKNKIKNQLYSIDNENRACRCGRARQEKEMGCNCVPQSGIVQDCRLPQNKG